MRMRLATEKPAAEAAARSDSEEKRRAKEEVGQGEKEIIAEELASRHTMFQI